MTLLTAVVEWLIFRGENEKKRWSWIANKFRIEFYRIFFFRIIFHLSNRTIFEWIQHQKNLTPPPYSWSRMESNEFWINFHRMFQIFFALSNQSNPKFSNRIERISNKFQFDSTLNKKWHFSWRFLNIWAILSLLRLSRL